MGALIPDPCFCSPGAPELPPLHSKVFTSRVLTPRVSRPKLRSGSLGLPGTIPFLRFWQKRKQLGKLKAQTQALRPLSLRGLYWETRPRCLSFLSQARTVPKRKCVTGGGMSLSVPRQSQAAGCLRFPSFPNPLP